MSNDSDLNLFFCPGDLSVHVFMLKGPSLKTTTNKKQHVFSKILWTWCKPQFSILHLMEWFLLHFGLILEAWKLSGFGYVRFVPSSLDESCFNWYNSLKNTLTYPAHPSNWVMHRNKASCACDAAEMLLTQGNLSVTEGIKFFSLPFFFRGCICRITVTKCTLYDWVMVNS